MHSSRCQSPHYGTAVLGSCRGLDGPHHVAPPSPPSRATGMIEWWKNSTGKAGAGPGGKSGRRRRPVSDRQQRGRRRTPLGIRL
ncbi:hypothetical protein WN55_04084 [Dufourea novaeangliae]|uniref:Uncharacterized protein n=1 Tax=Dufourea novaeangliae TaxID=178035 RepID=A0A154PKI8_DUFNO|nr:hypothetical protein WN55_04084 [Dufourea novaeangliae]